MKKYTSKSQKIDLYSEKYNLPKEEVNRILSEHEDLLTFEELKIKYDDPNIGQLPEWLEEDELDKMIWKTIHVYWSVLFEINGTKEELYMDLQEYIRKKIKLFENHNHVKSALVKRMITLAQQMSRHGKYFLGSLDEPIGKDTDTTIRYKYEPSVNDNFAIEDDLFLDRLRSIKNKSVRDLLIITGYLVCNIDSLRKDYIELLREYNTDIKNNILKLEQIIERNDQIDQSRIEGNKSYQKKKNIGIKDVIEALKLNIWDYKTENTTTTLNEIRYYIECYNIL